MKTIYIRHDLPNVLVIFLGAIVSYLSFPWLALIYIIIVLIGIFWMARFICPHCIGFDNGKCPSFYGKIATELFQKAEILNFKRAYNRNLWIVVLEWILPVIFALIFLILSFNLALLISFLLFLGSAFIWLPLQNRKNCRNCENEECPHRCTGQKIES